MIDIFAEIKPNAEAEQAMIGTILLNPDKVMPEAAEILEEEDFLISEYRTLYRTCEGYFIDGKPIEFVTLIAQLGDEYKPVLYRCAESVHSVASWKAYAQIVIDTAKRYRAYETASQLVGALTEGEKVENCQQLAVKMCEQLSTTTTGNTVSAKEGFSQFYIDLQKPVDYIRTGFSKLDKHSYIKRGDFVVIGARPSVGKTALTLQMMLHMSKSYRVVYFSLETCSNNLFGRMVSNLSGERLRSIKNRESIDYCRIVDCKDIIDKLDFYTVEAAGWTVPQIKAKAIQLGAEVIFIDYMGLVCSDGSSRYEKMTNISIDLHTLAQQSGIAVIALSQLNREGKDEPGMESLRESGQIEQDADIIMLLYAPDDIDEPAREIIIAKNKEGETGKVELNFNGDTQRFGEVETRYA